MIEPKFTPGPWELREVDGLFAVAHAKGFVFEEGDNQARIDWKLACAAPDMYVALDRLVFLHTCEQEGIECGMPTPSEWIKAVDDAFVALTKARGEK